MGTEKKELTGSRHVETDRGQYSSRSRKGRVSGINICYVSEDWANLHEGGISFGRLTSLENHATSQNKGKA